MKVKGDNYAFVPCKKTKSDLVTDSEHKNIHYCLDLTQNTKMITTRYTYIYLYEALFIFGNNFNMKRSPETEDCLIYIAP